MAAKQHSGKRSFWKQIRFKYRLAFFNESTLEEVWSFRLSQLSAFVSVGIFAFCLIAVTALVIIKTPIRNYLPGYLDAEIRNGIILGALRIDSLETALRKQERYLANVSDILTGAVTVDSAGAVHATDPVDTAAGYDTPRLEHEEAFIRKYEEDEKHSLTVLNPNPTLTEGVLFCKPVNGMLSSHYDAKKRHYGVDLAASLRESVLATLDGVVVYTGYDPQYGNVISVQHKNGFLSIYKHNESLLKETGDQVVAGEAIALIGNTGHLSTGPHLHFELWHEGRPVNPEEYIPF
jgi:lipoprotein NlpD